MVGMPSDTIDEVADCSRGAAVKEYVGSGAKVCDGRYSVAGKLETENV